MRLSTRNFKILPTPTTRANPGQTPGIWTFEDWIIQIPAPSGQNGVQVHFPMVGFVG